MPSLQPAFQFLEENARELFGEVRSMLYVGHRLDTHPWWRTTFSEVLGGPELSVLDIDFTNLQTAAPYTDRLIHGDIRAIKPAGYDLVFWDEGPEHVPREEALELLRLLMSLNRHVLISCPWGYQPQGHGPDDPEFHHWAPQVSDYESIGMFGRTWGVEFDGRGGGHGNLLAWF